MPSREGIARAAMATEMATMHPLAGGGMATQGWRPKFRPGAEDRARPGGTG